jgi:pyrimidine-nucleoside phosphorylase
LSTAPSLSPALLIARKRDRGRLSAAEITTLIQSFMAGQLADYQMTAFLMAALLNGLDDTETTALTQAMLHSGEVLRLPSVKRYKVDKHSTGGIGDKVSICLAPILACCGVAVPMISGRGLGHTGGTLDKLEAIPGYDTKLSSSRFERVVREVGASIIGQTAEIAPADRRIYALRDVTGTVESIPLIVASILSKKLAEGIDGLVLDVKAGRGAFMKTLPDARRLATALIRIGKAAGKDVSALITDMDTPLGKTIGNALEVKEAIAIVKGEGPSDTLEVTLALGAEALRLSGVAKTAGDARRLQQRAIDSGRAAECLERMIAAHRGDPRVVANSQRLPQAKVQLEVRAPRAGRVLDIEPMQLGLIAIDLGAGRKVAEQAVDHAVGIELCCELGQAVGKGDVIATIHAQSKAIARAAAERCEAAFRIGSGAAPKRKLILRRLT